MIEINMGVPEDYLQGNAEVLERIEDEDILPEDFRKLKSVRLSRGAK